MKNKIFFLVFWWKGVNAHGDWVLGVFLIPPRPNPRAEALGYGNR